ncbi:GNAT family N-acetyltransferase [Hanstruepera flava]|uniref:GNAT family N-acetyltransferase n=1 Tax=Hanstruepera flava TaxID=2930218 RepID=UPI0020276DBA|nr:GNAT family N-acetyltransferase [Hanstruepera flava]
MEKNNITYTPLKGSLNDGLLNSVLDLYKDLFIDADCDFFKERIQTQTHVFSVLAFSNDELIGFKIGYPKNMETFYSWIGGVKQKYRNQGIGKELAQLQEIHAKETGYKILQTKSMNRFKPMMILNLKNGFNITKVYTNEKRQAKIIFEKNLG